MKLKSIIILLLSITIVSCSEKLKSLDDTAIEVSAVNGEELSFSKNIEFEHRRYFIATGGYGSIRYLCIRLSMNSQLLGKIDDEIEGSIYETMTGDLNGNSKPEIMLLCINNSYKGFVDIVGYEFDGKIFRRYDLPPLDSDLAYGYGGNDHFYISKSKLIREFPILNTQPKAKRKITYSLNKNLEFSIEKFDEIKYLE
ncbi:MAG: hypothetical protein KIT33_14920 [Candidatus Kapabacteria bacterium]|nr:hypothetical protein [Ignavibacteriota bacterium]MCW5886261.1 hypothetical protein [Candidatus Kapabacteria bacterium]